jgi:hypothetical protein
MRQMMLAVLVVAVLNGGLAWLGSEVRRNGWGTPEQIEYWTWVATLGINLWVAGLFLLFLAEGWIAARRRERRGLPEPTPLRPRQWLASASRGSLIGAGLVLATLPMDQQGRDLLSEIGLLGLVFLAAGGFATMIAIQALFYAFDLAGRSRRDLDPTGTGPEDDGPPCPAGTSGNPLGEPGRDEADA